MKSSEIDAELLKACDGMDKPRKIDEVKTDEIKPEPENNFEEKAKELLKVSIPLLHKKLKDQGFLGIPTYMFEVLLKAKLNYTEFRLFLYIFKMTFGMNGAKREYYEPKEKRHVKLGKDTNRLYIDQISDAIGIGQDNINKYIKRAFS